MKKSLMILALVFVLSLTIVLTVSADQVGNMCYAICDNHGAYIHEIDEDDEEVAYYIYFWSEKSRKEIMGNHTKPYKNVVRQTRKLCNVNNMLPLNCMTGQVESPIDPTYKLPKKPAPGDVPGMN